MQQCNGIQFVDTRCTTRRHAFRCKAIDKNIKFMVYNACSRRQQCEYMHQNPLKFSFFKHFSKFLLCVGVSRPSPKPSHVSSLQKKGKKNVTFFLLLYSLIPRKTMYFMRLAYWCCFLLLFYRCVEYLW